MKTLLKNDRLSSRDRVLLTLARQAVDRVPVNYSANPDIDRRLKLFFGLEADDSEGLLQAFGVDFRSIGPVYTGPKLHPDLPGQGILVDDWGIHRRWVEHAEGQGYWDFCEFPLLEADEEMVANWPMPNPDHFDYAGVAESCSRYGNVALYAGNAGLGDVINMNILTSF